MCIFSSNLHLSNMKCLASVHFSFYFLIFQFFRKKKSGRLAVTTEFNRSISMPADRAIIKNQTTTQTPVSPDVE